MSLISYTSARELIGRIMSGEFTPLEVMEDTLRRIEKANPSLNAFVSIDADRALNEASGLTKSIAAGATPPPLAGLPIGVKDLEDVAGMVTSFGSVPFRNNVATEDSVQVARLREAGAIVVGKTKHAGIRIDGILQEPPLRGYSEPLESRANVGWIQRRVGGGGCRRDDPRGVRLRRAAGQSAFPPPIRGVSGSNPPTGGSPWGPSRSST